MSVLEPPYGGIWDLLKKGAVIPFLGAGASLSARTMDAVWTEEQPVCLPKSVELGQYLASKAAFPDWDPSDELVKVAQYYRVVLGRDDLRQRLHGIFAGDFAYGSLHELLAEIDHPLLIVTTNYDNLIERAFDAKGRPYDLVIYPTDNREHAAAVTHWKYGASEPEHVSPKKLLIDLERTSVIYKMHGAVDLHDAERDSYVIDEEDYTEFLVRIAAKTAIPAMFAEPFMTRRFLFLGYSLQDWNFRVALSIIERDLMRTRGSRGQAWAIQRYPSPLEQTLWDKRNVKIYDIDIQEFVSKLRHEQARHT